MLAGGRFLWLFCFCLYLHAEALPFDTNIMRRGRGTYRPPTLGIGLLKICEELLDLIKVHKSKDRTLFVAYVWPSKNKLGRLMNKIHFLQLLPVFYLIHPSSKQIICFDFQKQNSVLPIVFYVPWIWLPGRSDNFLEDRIKQNKNKKFLSKCLKLSQINPMFW
jgi:hypothetical protein